MFVALIAFISGCSSVSAAAPLDPPPCEVEETLAAAAVLQEAATKCAAAELRRGVAIEGTIDVGVSFDRDGRGRLGALHVSPAEASEGVRACLRRELHAGPACTRATEAFAFDSRIEVPRQRRPTVALRSSPYDVRVVGSRGVGDLAVEVAPTPPLSEADARRALTLELHRVVEECFIVAAGEALREQTPMHLDVPLEIHSIWHPGGRTSETIVSSPSPTLSACVSRHVGGTIRPRSIVQSVCSVRYRMPTRRYLHPTVVRQLERAP